MVDNHDDLLWRLRAISGLHNTTGKRIVSIGGAGGWGAGGTQAPALAHERWQFDIQSVSYDDLGRRLQSARQNPGFMKRCRAAADAYLSDKHVRLEDIARIRREVVHSDRSVSRLHGRVQDGRHHHPQLPEHRHASLRHHGLHAAEHPQ